MCLVKQFESFDTCLTFKVSKRVRTGKAIKAVERDNQTLISELKRQERNGFIKFKVDNKKLVEKLASNLLNGLHN